MRALRNVRECDRRMPVALHVEDFSAQNERNEKIEEVYTNSAVPFKRSENA